MKRIGITGLIGAAVLGLAATNAAAAPALRVQVDQNGDFVLLGNTLGHECGAGTPAPVVGTVACGASVNNADSAPDIYWRSDSPGNGQAQAGIANTILQARSTAVLNLPPAATVTHAFLYWGATLAAPGADAQVTFERPGMNGFSQTVNAIQSFQGANNTYHSVANVTSIVQTAGVGAYRVSGVDSANIVGVDNNNNFAGWWMVVLYQNPGDPLRNLAIFDGLDTVSVGNNQTVTLSGFLVPTVGFTGKLGVVTFEGDNSLNGDQLFFNGGTALTNGQNPANNFFNGTRSLLGNPVSNAGDLPQLAGTPQSMSGMDIDVVDVTAKLMGGQTSATVQATTTQDVYHLVGWVTSVSTFKPNFNTSTKSAVDVNGGALLAGDVIEYTIDVVNTGNDASINTVLTDPLPAGVTYVPGSLQVSAGVNTGPKTDMLADDQGEYDAGTNTVRFRLGMNANGMQGGTMAIGESTQVKFQVTINPGVSGLIANQAIINAGGALGAPPTDTPTDGNGGTQGQPPTEVVVDQCATDAECAAPTPYCDVAETPNVCVECLVDAHCSALTPTCDPATNTCVCIPTGAEVCDGQDNDCNGMVDDGNPGGGVACATNLPGACASGVTECAAAMTVCVPSVTPDQFPEVCDGQDNDCDGTADDGFNLGAMCTSGLGQCAVAGVIVCDGMGGATCNAIPGEPSAEICGDALDSDCDGNPNNGCTDTDNDGIIDEEEETLGTDPNDADSDDDGVIDGDEPDYADDTDGDGLINALDPDSDDDGLFDGTEMGKPCSGADTDPAANNCVPDADNGATTTDPLDADTDDGGVNDGAEDVNLNGAIDNGETDPTSGHGADDNQNVDTDGDGLSDGEEATIGTNPNDADSDDDGVIDGDEPNPAADSDGDGLINALDPDSDNDGLFDGTELGNDCSNPGTDPATNNCVPDADNGATTTSPIDADTDDGGVTDGSEDSNLNGAIDPGETDPTLGHGADDSQNVDTDGDGLTDDLEATIGTDPNDADSDNDGLIDGEEANPGDDTDGDGLINGLDPDSDNDGLFDGTEMGKDCSDADTDPAANNCIEDADNGTTTTSPLDADTDDGGVSDGDEDVNHNGAIDPGEKDPNNPADDPLMPECTEDADCGGATSGQVCDFAIQACVDGCRGTGNGCPSGQECTSIDDTIGECRPSGGTGGGGSGGSDGYYAVGNGLICAASPANDGSSLGWLAGLAATALLGLRRRRRGA